MRYGENTSVEVERVARDIVDASFKVHHALGPGILESVYEICLAYELSKRGLKVLRQVKVPIVYDGQQLDDGLRLDLMVEDCVIVEVKAVEKMLPLFEAQALTYLKLTGKRLALLINFNVPNIRDGIKRIIR
jgi:GxxExxY protein